MCWWVSGNKSPLLSGQGFEGRTVGCVPLVNVRKAVHWLCFAIQVGAGRVNRDWHQIGRKQCFDLRHTHKPVKKKKSTQRWNTTENVRCSACGTPKNNACILHLALEMQVRGWGEGGFCAYSDAAPRGHPLWKEVMSHITLGFPRHLATFWAHCPRKAGRVSPFTETESSESLERVLQLGD